MVLLTTYSSHTITENHGFEFPFPLFVHIFPLYNHFNNSKFPTLYSLISNFKFP